MEFRREEILPGVFLTALHTDKFKTAAMSLSLLAQLDGVCYAERVTIDTPAHIRATKKAIKKGIQNQIDRKGFSIIEVISPCPVQWGLAPCDAYRRIEREVEPFYGLKVFKDIDAEVQA